VKQTKIVALFKC